MHFIKYDFIYNHAGYIKWKCMLFYHGFGFLIYFFQPFHNWVKSHFFFYCTASNACIVSPQGGEWWLKMEEISPRTISWGKQRVAPLFQGLLYDLTTCPVAGSAVSLRLMEAKGGRAQPEQRWRRRPLAAGKPCPIRLWHRLCFSTWSRPRVQGVGVWKWFAIHILSNSNALCLTWMTYTCSGRTRYGERRRALS